MKTTTTTSTMSSALLLPLLLQCVWVDRAASVSCVSCSWSGVDHPTKACAAADVGSIEDAAGRLHVRTVNCGATSRCGIKRVLYGSASGADAGKCKCH